MVKLKLAAVDVLRPTALITLSLLREVLEDFVRNLGIQIDVLAHILSVLSHLSLALIPK